VTDAKKSVDEFKEETAMKEQDKSKVAVATSCAQWARARVWP
jgi:hypothetical protein